MKIDSNSHDILAELPDNLPIQLTDSQLSQIAVYVDMLLFWNRKLNLIGIQERSRVVKELICDSFWLAKFLENLSWRNSDSLRIIEPGAGAGLPGVPLRIVWPTGNYTMIEPREKRALFLTNVISRLQLPATTIFRGRLEDFFSGIKKELQSEEEYHADCIISRAFRPWPQILKLCKNYITNEGYLIFMTNEAPPASIREWHIVDKTQYEISTKIRWLWAVSPACSLTSSESVF